MSKYSFQTTVNNSTGCAAKVVNNGGEILSSNTGSPSCHHFIFNLLHLPVPFPTHKILTFLLGILKGKWILRGTMSQSSHVFSSESRNTQCTANAVMSVAFLKIREPKKWTKKTIDQVNPPFGLILPYT